MQSQSIPDGLFALMQRVHACARAQGLRCYLVGGFLRDQLLGRRPTFLNIDLMVERGALTLCQIIAEQLSGAYVLLDEALGAARVVLPIAAGRLELDISDARGPALDEDLRRRDFTINAIAIALEDWLRHPSAPHPLTDPLKGVEALARHQLLPCFPGTFEEDPVRIMRAFRFMAQLDFTLDPAATPLMQHAVPLLPRVAGERIRDELMAMCETNRAHGAFQALNALGVLDVLCPELRAGRGVEQGGYHHLDVLGHQLETVAQADRILADFAEFSEPLREPMAAHCAQTLVERRSRKALIKLAGLLHDIGKPSKRTVEPDGEIWFLGHEHAGVPLAAAIVDRLRFSTRESQMISALVLHHLRPGFLSREPQLTRRAIYRFFKDLGDHGPSCLLLWWSDRMATRGPKSRLDQLDQQRSRLEELLHAYFFQAEEVVRPQRLLDGHQLMRAFGLTSGPRIGELLAAIEEAQAEGRIHTAEEALQLAREQLHPPSLPSHDA